MKFNYRVFPTLITKHSKIIDFDRREKITNYILSAEGRPDHLALSGNVRTNFTPEKKFFEELESNVPEVFGIKNLFTELVNEYAQEIGICKLRITNSWYTIQHKGSILKQHTHPGSIVSCAIYINADDDSSKIYFDNPLPVQFYMRDVIEEHTDFSSRFLEFKPESGDALIFPSWISHGSYYNQNQTENRIIISFNTDYLE
jgi:uncharacterized protein (TIGR02466 family)